MKKPEVMGILYLECPAGKGKNPQVWKGYCTNYKRKLEV